MSKIIELPLVYRSFYDSAYENYREAFGDSRKAAIYNLLTVIENSVKPNAVIPDGKYLPIYNYPLSYVLEEGCDCPNGVSHETVNHAVSSAVTFINETHQLLTKGFVVRKIRLRRKKLKSSGSGLQKG